MHVQEQIETLEKKDFPAANVADIQKECQRAAVAMQDFYEKMIFIARLQVDIRVKVMEAMPKFAYDALKIAMATETLILDKKDSLKMPLKVLAVKVEEECDEEVLEEEEMDEEEAALNSLNTIRVQRGKMPFKKFPRSNGNGNGGAQPKTTNGEPRKCRYCKKSGHMQKECYKWSDDHCARQTVQSQQSD